MNTHKTLIAFLCILGLISCQEKEKNEIVPDTIFRVCNVSNHHASLELGDTVCNMPYSITFYDIPDKYCPWHEVDGITVYSHDSVSIVFEDSLRTIHVVANDVFFPEINNILNPNSYATYFDSSRNACVKQYTFTEYEYQQAINK